MTKRKKKLKKIFKYPLIILVIIILSYITITIYKKYENKNVNTNIPVLDNKDSKDEIKTKLSSLNYSNEDITFIKKELNENNVKYLIENKIDNKLAMDIINETYYIDEYLEKYIKYFNENPNLSSKEIITRINAHLDEKFYTNTEKTDDSLGKFVILNKHYYSDGNYKGKDLIKVDSKYNLYGYEFELSKECYEAFLKMYNDAKEKGYAFKINSAYRSYEKQINIYQGWVNKDGQELADTYSARAGYSEHQTGYAFDVRDFPFTNDDYSKTKSFTWVSENAHKYGFIIRFPKNKEYITGYQYEPWHYRYVGIEAAKYIHDNDITFEEYYEYFIRFNNPRNLS